MGRIAVVGGSTGMAGAAALAGIAALRSGSGLVTVATARQCQATVAAFHPSLMTIGLEDDDAGRIGDRALPTLRELLSVYDCVAWGPGLGVSDPLRGLTRAIVDALPKPMVIDADGLNHLGPEPRRFNSASSRVLTPHPGELRRLVPDTGNERAELEAVACRLAATLGSIVVLKGHRTLVTDGTRQHHNSTGNAGLATAGSGDVLTGIIASLIGQKLAAWDAALLGCHLHGLAGDIAACEKGQHALISTDIIEALPAAINEWTAAAH